MFSFFDSVVDLKQPGILAAVSLLTLLLLLAIILIVRKVRRTKEPDNIKELEFAALRGQTTEELHPVQYLHEENVNAFVAKPSDFPNETTIPMNMNLTQNPQVEALEKEVTEIKDSLYRMKGTEGTDLEYRELKNKWYEKQQQLRDLTNPDMTSSPAVNGFIHYEKENNTETAVLLSTEYYEASNGNREKNDQETPTTHSSQISELLNTISEKEKEAKKLHDRISELEELPKILKEKNTLLIQELEALKTPTNSNPTHSVETLRTSAATDIEIKDLLDKISELESLPAVLTEKNLLVEFLQNQLDKQVKNSFEIEKEHSQLKAQMLQENEAFQQKQTLTNQMREDLQKKEQYNTLITAQYEKALEVNEKYKQQLDETIEKLSSLQAQLRSTMESSDNSEHN